MNDIKSLAELDKLLEESIKYRRESLKLEAEAHKLWNESKCTVIAGGIRSLQ